MVEFIRALTWCVGIVAAVAAALLAILGTALLTYPSAAVGLLAALAGGAAIILGGITLGQLVARALRR